MKKVSKNLIRSLAVICTVLMVGQAAMIVQAAVEDEYLTREVTWSGNKCTELEHITILHLGKAEREQHTDTYMKI